MSDHCPACQVVRELTVHRDTTAPDSGRRRADITFCIIIARGVCPENRTVSNIPGDLRERP